MRVLAMLDEGSTVTLLDADIAKKIGARGTCDILRIQGVGGMGTVDANSETVTVGVSNCRGGPVHIVNKVRTVRNLALPAQSLFPKDVEHHEHLKGIRFEYYTDSRPAILLGQDNWTLVVSREIRGAGRGAPVASRTILGWVVHGYTTSSSRGGIASELLSLQYQLESTRCTTVDDCEDAKLHELVKEYFKLDSIGVSAVTRKNSLIQRAESLLDATTRRACERWETGLLWRSDTILLPDSYANAFNRLKSLERKLAKEPIYAKAYIEQIENLLRNGYANKIASERIAESRTWYLPHFGVRNQNKPGKLRIVFDAAAKSGGVSLNDNLLTGPDLLNSLPGVLMRFRQERIAFIADIKEMFLQIKVRTEDRHAQRFLWRNMDQTKKPDVYCMSSLVFGATSSPCSAQYVKNKNALEFQVQFPRAVDAIIKKHYMDDYLDSAETEQEVIDLINAVREIHRQGGFEMHGWASNSSAVLKHLPRETLASGSIELGMNNNLTEKTLGLRWEPREDLFTFNINLTKIAPGVVTGIERPTKREVLRVIMTVFDPLGFLAPFTMRSKILMQSIWRSGIGWDEKLKDEDLKKWREWTEDLRFLPECRICRHYGYSQRHTSAAELHMFCDASEKGYAAVGYWKLTRNDGNVGVAFITSKSRVAPNKPVSIPRLELQAALLASRLAHTIAREHEIKINRRVFWTDSTTVLCWIRSDSRTYKAFVAHRLGEIDELTEVNEWRWVPTKENPADDATRDQKIPINSESRWLKGPSFLKGPEAGWPIQRSMVPSPEGQAEQREEMVALNITIEESILPDIQRFSSWRRLIRSTAWVLVFIERCRKRVNTEMSLEQLQQAELLWIRQSQQESFRSEIGALANGRQLSHESRLLQLTPFLDAKGIIRLGGRAGAADSVGRDCRTPIIMDGRHPYTRLMILHYHQQAGHGSSETVVNELRQKYWILQLRPSVRSVSHRCQVCKIRRAKPQPPRMGDLPLARLAHHQRPFTHCGVDYFGPMMVTIGRRHEKRWGVIFTCLTTRAIHLEIAASLTTDSTIMALRRMAARRGFPSVLYSDNGTNLRGAETELRRVIEGLDEETQRRYASEHGMEWKFIPPAAPHMGGSWERLIRCVKVALKATLRERAPREETLATLMAEAERTVNSRPLTYVSVDPRDPEALTPFHFLIGSSSTDALPASYTDADLYGRKQWRIAQRLADVFWSRWVREYLPTLLRRKKWASESRSLETGTVVIVVDHTVPRNMWVKGIVTATFPGTDGRIRIVELRTAHGTIKRPVTKLIALPTQIDCVEDATSNTRGEDVGNATQ